jgi:hypothetical protein
MRGLRLHFMPSFAAALFVLSAANAHAYLDAGTGSYIFQMAIAGLMGALFMVNVFWQRIVSFFRRSPKKEAKAGPEASLNGDE